jgi:glutamine amidotransferase-like uncharacterized protein
MTEREMQEVLWQRPQRLLHEPLKQFAWEAASDVGRADLVFEDRHGRLLIIEAKRGKLPRGAIDQLPDYFGMMKQRHLTVARIIGVTNPMTLLLRGLIIASLVLMSTAFIGCEKGMLAKGSNDSATATSGDTAPILLFNGTGTSPNDVVAIEEILRTNHLNYSTANSSQLNEMSELQMRGYRLLIVPGGNFIEMGNSLTPGTAANIRNAVQKGLSYAGICAGAFLAGNSTHYNGFNLTSGVRFGFYAAENQGVRKTVVAIATAGAAILDQYWEDGPQFAGWGAVVGKYPDGTPAVVEGTFGSGWIILSGVHPEAPESWRHGMTFSTPASEDNAYAGMLIRAALNHDFLSHY